MNEPLENATDHEVTASAPESPAEEIDAETLAFADKFAAFADADPEALFELPAVNTPDEHAKVLQRLGAPEDPTAYGFDKIEEVDADTQAWAGETFQAAGVLPWQAQTIASAFLTHQHEVTAELTRADAVAAEGEQKALRAEWGQHYDAQYAAGRNALAALGVDHDALTWMEAGGGVAAAMKLGHFFSSLMPAEMLAHGAKSIAEAEHAKANAKQGNTYRGADSAERDMARRWYSEPPASPSDGLMASYRRTHERMYGEKK